MEVKSKEYKIGDKTFIFRPNMRAMIEFERIAKKPAGLVEGTEDNMLMAYCGTKAGMKKAGKEFTIEFEEFIDLVDGDFDLFGRLAEDDEEEDEEPKKA